MYSYYAASVYKQSSALTSGLYALLLPLKPYLTKMQICQVRATWYHIHVALSNPACAGDWLTTSVYSVPCDLVLRWAIRRAAAILHRGLPRKRVPGCRDRLLADLRHPAHCAICGILCKGVSKEGTGQEGSITFIFIIIFTRPVRYALALGR